MSKKYGTLTSELLTAIGEATGFFEWPLPGTSAWAWKQWKNRKYLRNYVYNLKKSGLIRVKSKAGKKFLELTSRGELETLLLKSAIKPAKIWDGQWRVIIFDIPEDHRDKRDHLRWLLKRNNFYKLQASVFINPYPLNREAVQFLKESGLIQFIRIMRVNEMDNDSDLKKIFGLK